MNKNPEKFSIEYLIRNGYKLEEDYNNFARQVVNIAIESLEKQIPKKPIEYECPVCKDRVGYKFGESYMMLHCENCGQKLDWSK